MADLSPPLRNGIRTADRKPAHFKFCWEDQFNRTLDSITARSMCGHTHLLNTRIREIFPTAAFGDCPPDQRATGSG